MIALAVLAPHSASLHPTPPLDLSAAAVFAPSEPTAQELAALEMVLLKHVRARTNSSWGLATWIDGASGHAASATSAVRLARWPEAAQGCRCCAGQENFSRPESFLLCTDQADAAEASDDTAWVVAADQRGFLFGVGRLLRELRIEGTSVQLPPLHVRVEPKAEMRAHGLALPQDKANLEEFIKDLAAFGMNTISNAYPDAVAIASQLGLDVQVGTSPCPWVGNAPEKKCLASRAAQWRGLTKLDHVTMAGGDDGSVVLSPPQQMGTGKAFAEVLHAVHPEAKLWISLQEYSATNFTLFMKLLREPGTETWLAGLFNGPVRFTSAVPPSESDNRRTDSMCGTRWRSCSSACRPTCRCCSTRTPATPSRANTQCRGCTGLLPSPTADPPSTRPRTSTAQSSSSVRRSRMTTACAASSAVSEPLPLRLLAKLQRRGCTR